MTRIGSIKDFASKNQGLKSVNQKVCL